MESRYPSEKDDSWYSIAANGTWLWRFTACNSGHGPNLPLCASQAKARCDPGTGCCFAWRPLQRHRKIKANQHGLHFGQVTSKSFQPIPRRFFWKEWTFRLVLLLLEKTQRMLMLQSYFADTFQHTTSCSFIEDLRNLFHRPTSW